MIGMFRGHTKGIGSSLNNWDVSKVKNMSNMFTTSTFNQDISNWNVSSVTNMLEMFQMANKFNQDIGNWNVSNVLLMDEMFDRASAFNQDLSAWDVLNVTSCNTFSRDANNWTLPKPNFTNCSP